MTINRRTLRIVGQGRQDLILTINGTLDAIQREYVGIISRTMTEFEELLVREAAETTAGRLSIRTIQDRARLESILAEARTGLDAAAGRAEIFVRDTIVGDIVPLSVDYTDALVRSQLPAETRWALRVSGETMEAVVAQATPRFAYFSSLGTTTVNTLNRVLTDGVLAGQNPKVVARRLTRELGRTLDGGMRRAQRIARTEMLDAYRNTDTLLHRANADIIEGWIWQSEGSETTCASCWAMHGTFFTNDVAGPNDHPNGYCWSVPSVDPRYSLQGDVPTRDELWARLTPEQQVRVLGPTRYELQQQGVPWDAFSTQVEVPGWRSMRQATSVSDLLTQYG